MDLRKRIKRLRRKIQFKRKNSNRHVRLRTGWRRPKGRHSKIRQKRKSAGIRPGKGYGGPREIKGLHPSGRKEIRVENLKEAERVEDDFAVRISGNVGKKKKQEILKILEKKKVKILNKGFK